MVLCSASRDVWFQASDSGHFKTIVAFECRGIEPVSFDPRVRHAAISNNYDSIGSYIAGWVLCHRRKQWVTISRYQLGKQGAMICELTCGYCGIYCCYRMGGLSTMKMRKGK